ncbi:enhancer of split m8 protein-like [Musca vetustissima]|uniref:enhancer of split m8 protein-like n=1 Tax=Musca vetustissima TaxID=27455 RepID=UPI002AB6FDFF|nr:enhancer of split m8 protein-like [Musca vetustissima]
MEYATKTEIYQKIKKPLLERQRRARINKSLDGLKQLMIDLNGDSKILRMDKAEMLETTITFLQSYNKKIKSSQKQQQIPMDAFRNGYMNAVNEVSRVLASTPGMTVEMGKSVMSHLGRSYNRLQQQYQEQQQQRQQSTYQTMQQQPLTVDCAPLSPASSGYHSDDSLSPVNSPVAAPSQQPQQQQVWRPW